MLQGGGFRGKIFRNFFDSGAKSVLWSPELSHISCYFWPFVARVDTEPMSPRYRFKSEIFGKSKKRVFSTRCCVVPAWASCAQIAPNIPLLVVFRPYWHMDVPPLFLFFKNFRPNFDPLLPHQTRFGGPPRFGLIFGVKIGPWKKISNLTKFDSNQ